MKIFSLETKKHLVGWSILIGIFVNVLIFTLITFQSCSTLYPSASFGNYDLEPGIGCSAYTGFPLALEKPVSGAIDYDPSILGSIVLNFLFWFFATLIVLSLIRHFRKKKLA